MPLYDILMKNMDGLGSGKFIAAGALARTVSVLIIAPLDLVRTRTQAYFQPMQLAAANAAKAGTSANTWTALSLAASELGAVGRLQLLWRGNILCSLERLVCQHFVHTWLLIMTFKCVLRLRDSVEVECSWDSRRLRKLRNILHFPCQVLCIHSLDSQAISERS